MSTPRVRVYLACSLDGCIAGPDDDLSFLSHGAPEPDAATDALTYEQLMGQVGAMLMGRRTHDIVRSFGTWPYGELPVLVATRRPLEPAAPTVRAVQGDIASLIAQARQAAGEGDVYLDGGDLVRQALDAGLVDELCLTLVPVLVGDGVRLFEGVTGLQRFELVHSARYGGMLQLTVRPSAAGEGDEA